MKLTGTGKTVGQVWADTEAVKLAKNCDIPSTERDATCAKQGTLAVGAACSSDTQCAKGKCELSGYCGKCVAVPQLGDSCKLGDICAAGSFCDGASCKAKVAIDGTCTDANQCVTGAFCKAGGKCAALGEAGAACADQNECRTNLVCSSENKCVAVTFGKAGDICNTYLGKACELGTFCQKSGKCETITTGSTCGGANSLKCGAGQYCKLDSAAGTSSCASNAAVGAACSSTEGPACEAEGVYTYCINSKCGFADSTVCK